MNQRGGRATRFLRLAIGTILLASAVGKFLDVAGFTRILEQYRVFSAETLPLWSWAIPSMEFAVALWLFSGWRLVGAAVASVVLHVSYAAWSAVAVWRGLRLPNCGCFGVFLARPLGWTTVWEDVALIAASVALLLLARRGA